MWADSKWTSEKLQLEMQVVKSVNGFLCTGCTGGQIQFGGKHGHVCFVAAEGPPPLNEISRLNGKVFQTRDEVQKKVNNKARPNVWAKLKDRKRRWRGLMDDARPMEQKHKDDVHRLRETKRKRERGRDRRANQIPPCRTCI